MTSNVRSSQSSQKERLSVCNRCSLRTWYSKEQPCYACKEGTLKLIDNSYLDPRFTPYFDSGDRIEIVYTDGLEAYTMRCYVGRSTGWKPVYLALSRSNSRGGSPISLANITSIRTTGLNRFSKQGCK